MNTVENRLGVVADDESASYLQTSWSQNVKSMFVMLLVGLVPLTASADEWLLRKNRGNGNCSVQLASPDGTPAPNAISTHASRKEACEAAKALSAADAAEASKCAAYTPNSITECKKEGVELGGAG